MRVPIFRGPVVTRLRTLLVGLLLAVTVAACGTGDPGEAPSGEQPTTLTLATGFAVDDLDPVDNGFWMVEFGGAELLMRPVLAGEPEPWLLQSLQNVDDNTWVLTIEPDAAFQNGNPLDGDALAAVMSYALQNVAGLSPLAGTTVEATADREVTVTTPSPAPNLPYLLADESKFVIFDLAAYQATNGDRDALPAAEIYTGPYVVQSLDPQTMELTADPGYWRGAPPLDSVTVRFIEEAQARILAVQNGEADIALYPPTGLAKSIEGRTDAYWVAGEARGPSFQLQMNQQSGPMTDARVRKAVLAAIDYQEIAEDVMNGLYEVSDGMYTPKAPYHQTMYTTDVAEAEQLLTEAGWVVGGDGRRTKNGAPLTITVLTYPQQPDADTLALAIQSQLDEIGVTVAIQQVPDTEEAKYDPSIGWDAAIEGNGTISFSGDPTSALQSYFRSDGPRNHSIDDPQLDALIDQYATTMDPAQADATLGEIQAHIAENAYMGWLGMRTPGIVVGPAWQSYEIPMANLWVGYETQP